MGSTHTRKAVSTLLAVFMLWSLSAVAVADTLTPSAATLSVEEGATGTVTFTLVKDAVTPFDHKNCDVQGGAHAVLVRFASSDTSTATVSPAEHLYTNCGESVVVTVTGVAVGGPVNVTATADMDDERTNVPSNPNEGDPPGIGFHTGTVAVTVTEPSGPGGDECNLETGENCDEVCEAPAAPAWAAHILKANPPLKNKGKPLPSDNYVAMTAHQMGPGTAFTYPTDTYQKEDEGYGDAVRQYLESIIPGAPTLTMPADWPEDECYFVDPEA